jgi:hypothetical protein
MSTGSAFRGAIGVAVGLFLAAAVVIHVTRGPGPENASGAARSLGHESLSEPQVLRSSVRHLIWTSLQNRLPSDTV